MSLLQQSYLTQQSFNIYKSQKVIVFRLVNSLVLLFSLNNIYTVISECYYLYSFYHFMQSQKWIMYYNLFNYTFLIQQTNQILINSRLWKLLRIGLSISYIIMLIYGYLFFLTNQNQIQIIRSQKEVHFLQQFFYKISKCCKNSYNYRYRQYVFEFRICLNCRRQNFNSKKGGLVSINVIKTKINPKKYESGTRKLKQKQVKKIKIIIIMNIKFNPDIQRKKTSIAFVTFDSEQRRNQCLKKYQITGLKKAFYKFCSCCSPTAIHSQHISLQPAPSPKDIIWENVELPYTRTKLKRLFSYIISFLLVLTSSIGIYFLSFPNNQTQIVQNKIPSLFGILTAVLVQITNLLIVGYIEWSSNNFEGHMTHTQAKKSMTKKLILFIFLNTAIIPYAIYAYRLISSSDQNNYINEAFNQLIYNVAFIVFGNIVKPITMLISAGRIFQHFRRKKEMKKGKLCVLSQYQANKLFEPPEFPIQVLYSLATASLLKTFFFLNAIPTIVLPQLILNIFVIFVSRYILFKRSRMPKQITSQLNLTVSKIAQFCIPLYFLGRIGFAVTCDNVASTRQCNFPSFESGLKHLFQDKLTIIEAFIVVAYCILVIMFNLDESIASIFVNKQQSKSILEDRQKMDLQFDYLNANSIYKLIEENDSDTGNFYNNQKLQRRFIEDQFERKFW